MSKSTATAIALGFVGLAAAGCAGRDVSGPQASLVQMVVIDDLYYEQAADFDPETRPLGEPYAQVLRYVDCSQGVWRGNTHISAYCPLENGDSNFLPAGTILYRIEGVDPAVGLAVFREYDVTPVVDSHWVELAPRVDASGCPVTTAGSLCAPPGTA